MITALEGAGRPSCGQRLGGDGVVERGTAERVGGPEPAPEEAAGKVNARHAAPKGI